MKLIPVEAVPNRRGRHHLQDLIEEFVKGDDTLEQLKKLAERTKDELNLLKQDIGDINVAEYSITKLETAESGYLATYQLAKDGSPFGTKINIPKDFLVKSATIGTASGENMPYEI